MPDAGAAPERDAIASPIGHALAGWAVYSWVPRQAPGRSRSLLILSVAASLAPDFDFLPGLLLGQPALYHQGVSHSVGAALAASLLAAALFARRGSGFRVPFAVSFLSYASHLLLDVLGPDNRIPYGIPLLWPLSAQPFLFPHPFLMGIRHAKAAGDSIALWISGALHPANLLAVLLEVVTLVPVLLGGLLFQRIMGRRRDRAP